MKILFLLFFTLLSLTLHSQTETQIFSENVGNPGDTSILVTFYSGFQNSGSLTFFGNAQVQSNETSSGYTEASGGGNILINNDGGRFCRISNINTQNFIWMEVSFGIHKNTTESNGSGIAFEYSIDGGFNFIQIPVVVSNGDGTDTWQYVTANLPFATQNRENLVLQWRRITPIIDSTLYRIDDISLTGDYFTPVISPSDTSFMLPPVALGDYDSIEYTVSAKFLIQDVEIVSENPSFEIWDPVDSLWGLALTLPKSGQVLDGDTVTVLVRHNPLNAIGDEVGVFRHSTFGGQDTVVSVYGTSIATEPLVVTPLFSATAFQNGFILLQWEPGDGDKRVIIAREFQAVSFVPSDGVSPLPANEDFSLASDINGNKVVFIADSSVTQATIFGLNPATTHHFAIFEYNEGTGNSQNYLTDDFAVAQALTPFGPPGLQITQASTAFLINFQETVPGVLNGAYNGTGLSPTAALGKLNTSSWRVSINNGQGGTTQYNSQATTFPNFGRGTNPGPSATNGLYAFQTGEGNIAMGIKPFQQLNNNVFSVNPGGFFELRTQNKTNQTVQEAYVSFVYFVLNNGNFSTEFKFSYSLTGANFIDVPELSFKTPIALDNPSAWKKYVRTIKIPGLNIPQNGFLHLRWSGQDSGGSGTRDAIAIDDITVAFDPEPTFAGGTFSGNINSGLLMANARLNGPTAIIDSIILEEGAVLATGVHTMTMGPGVSIDETDGYIKGNLLISRVIEANVAQTFGGIGLSITTSVAAGLTQVKRVTGIYELSGDNESIRRWFEISPANNSNLSATMAFTFKDFESPNFTPTQANFRLYRRHIGSQGGWAVMNPGVLAGTTYTINGISSFNDQITGADFLNAPLPLDWLSFGVSHDKGFNLLKWVTANEVNTSLFEIEKSYNAKDFTSIAVEPARGGVLTETYQYSDKHDRSGLIYYRIKQIDHDQTFSYSPLRSVIATSSQKLQVYPTLVSDHTVIFSDREMDAQISIVNAQGALIKLFDLQLSAGEQALSVNDLAAGVYWIRIENKEISETFRIVKQ